MQASTKEEIQGTEKEFLDVFHQLCYSRQAWQVWADLMSAIACSIANVFEINQQRRQDREKEFERCIQALGGDARVPAKLLAIITMALERNPNQDFLGKLYMQLELGSHWHGQFFTPASVAECMANITISDQLTSEDIKKDYVAIMDPSCGAGVTLIAAANIFKRRKINYQQKVFFVGQDIDRVVGQMCYIQLSLLGCAGYICIANTLTNPINGPVLQPLEGKGQEFWYTPFYYSERWQMRIFLQNMRRLMAPLKVEQPKKQKESNGMWFFFFDDEKEELING